MIRLNWIKIAMYHNDDIPCQLSILLSKLNSNKFHYPDLTQFNPAKTSNISPNISTNISTNIPNQLHHPESRSPWIKYLFSFSDNVQNSKTETNFGEKNSPASVNSLNSILNSKSNFVVCTCGQIFSESKSDSPQRNLLFGKCIWRSNKIIKS